jgi:hypothetical protein
VNRHNFAVLFKPICLLRHNFIFRQKKRFPRLTCDGNVNLMMRFHPMNTPKLASVTLLTLALVLLAGCNSSPMDKLAKENLTLQKQLQSGEITQDKFNELSKADIAKAQADQAALDKAAADKAAADKAAADKAAADKAAADAAAAAAAAAAPAK